MVPGQSSGFDLTRNYGMVRRRRSGCTELNEKGWEMLRPQKRLWTGGRRETEEVVVLNKLLSWSSLATDADGWMLCFGAFRGYPGCEGRSRKRKSTCEGKFNWYCSSG